MSKGWDRVSYVIGMYNTRTAKAQLADMVHSAGKVK